MHPTLSRRRFLRGATLGASAVLLAPLGALSRVKASGPMPQHPLVGTGSNPWAALTADTQFRGPRGNLVRGIRCGTVNLHDEPAALAAGLTDQWRREATVRFQRMITIPLAVHIVTMNSGFGDVPDAQIQDQVNVLSAAYASTGFTFSLSSIDRTANSSWSSHFPGSAQEVAMKQALAIDPANQINLYFCNLGGGLLGYSNFPWWYPENSFMHGATMLFSSVPGGSAAPFNEGDTATHELGHYLGLYHTFEGGCSFTGDRVLDTPPQSFPSSGCPIGSDTCALPGLDPIHNFMDYSDDACMFEFSAGQRWRMRIATVIFRPSLLT